MNKFVSKHDKGFTLVELLVVIGILTVLFSIVLIAINPSRQFSQANDTQRRGDISTFLNAIYQYSADNNNQVPGGVITSLQTIASGSGNLDLCTFLVPTYIEKMPADPTTGYYTNCTDYNTGYTIISSGENEITISATPEVVKAISITK